MKKAVILALEAERWRMSARQTLADRLDVIANDLASLAAPGGREVAKDEIDAMWGFPVTQTAGVPSCDEKDQRREEEATKQRLGKQSSMAIDKEASRRWRRRLIDVLNTVWDPIGGCPEDEYDAYVGEMAAMLRAGADDKQLVAYLWGVEADHMGLSVQPGLEERLERTVAAIRKVELD